MINRRTFLGLAIAAPMAARLKPRPREKFDLEQLLDEYLDAAGAAAPIISPDPYFSINPKTYAMFQAQISLFPPRASGHSEACGRAPRR